MQLEQVTTLLDEGEPQGPLATSAVWDQLHEPSDLQDSAPLGFRSNPRYCYNLE